jgi:glycosyltransferase involved in cell wall biosynthesis
VAVEAVGRLAARGIDASLEVVGPIQDPTLADELLGRAGRLGIADRVHVRGPTDRVDELIARSDIVLTCSRVEPLGLVPAEALARGRPVVATRTGGLPEVVREGETGLLVPPGDPQALADAIAGLAADPAGARAMAASGRADVERRFDTRVARARVEDELARVLAA